MRRLILALSLLLAPAAAQAIGPVATGFSGRGSETNSRGVYPAGETRAIIDMTPMYAPAINDRYDADGSIYRGFSYTVGDSATDFTVASTVDTSSALGADGCGTAQCQMAFPSASTVDTNTLTLPAAWRWMLCRETTAVPYSPCSGSDGTCTSSGASIAHPFPIVIYHAGIDEYVPYGITSFPASAATVCAGTGDFNVTVAPRLARAITTADSLAPMYRDVIHYSTYASRAVGNFIANATVDSTYIPKTYDLPGKASGVGTMETDCNAGPGTNWEGVGGTVTIGQTTPGTTEYSSQSLRNAVWGKGCKLLKDSGNLDPAANYLRSMGFTTAIGTVYTVRFLARTGTADGNGIIADVLDSGGATETTVWDFFFGPTTEAASTGGWHGIAHATGVGCQVTGRNGVWSLCVMKFTASTTSTKLRFGLTSATAATTLWVDEVYVFKSNNQLVGEMTPIFDVGNVSVTLDGDSQVNLVYGDLSNGFAWALGRKANTRLVCPPSLCFSGTPGAQTADLVKAVPLSFSTYGYPKYKLMRPGLAVFNSMVNDFPNATWFNGSTPSTPDTTKTMAYTEALFKTIGSYAGLPVWLTTQPWGYAVGASVSSGCGAWQCSILENAVVTAILHDQN